MSWEHDRRSSVLNEKKPPPRNIFFAYLQARPVAAEKA